MWNPCNETRIGVPWQLTGLRIWHCHCYGSDCCCGSSSIHGLGTSTCRRRHPPKKEKKRKKLKNRKILDPRDGSREQRTQYTVKSQGAAEPKCLKPKRRGPQDPCAERIIHYGNKLLGVPAWWSLWGPMTQGHRCHLGPLPV